ncbi:MAG: hypothetical protein ACREOY_05135, partial [Candidatus Dormibacteraceae bacterium]
REALAANARTRITFQCGQDDARNLAREFEPWLGDRQLRNLQPYQVAVRQFLGGRTERPFTGVTRPETPSLGEESAQQLVAAALQRTGRVRAQVEREIEARLSTYAPKPAVRPAAANGGTKPLRTNTRSNTRRTA